MHKRQLKVKAFSLAHAGSKARHSAEQSPASHRSGDTERSRRRSGGLEQAQWHTAWKYNEPRTVYANLKHGKLYYFFNAATPLTPASG